MVTKTNGHNIDTDEILDGFLYSYRQLDTNATKLYEASANLYSLIELLVAKGIIGIDELDQRKKAVENRLNNNFKEAGIGVRVQNAGVDKYNLEEESEINCDNRKHICRAACCTFAYALSLQDIHEGIRWSLGKPFMNAKEPDGYCVHLNKDTLACSIYERRPAVCRQYSCRNDQRVWLDYDKMIIKPDVFKEQESSNTEESTDA
jgi:hypothetical protein